MLQTVSAYENMNLPKLPEQRGQEPKYLIVAASVFKVYLKIKCIKFMLEVIDIFSALIIEFIFATQNFHVLETHTVCLN